ncbi:unnamed protein product [Acanthoscelides obtectus]|uniref:Uncharacterized protein n=1 Tax=Acanthoscelides obtectus TaxID=200917 RepID=A0A9P0KMI9_ACAOB|nr:unnamed protein product [Acanthoscelides obtectus]CAK1645783.1 hypothetical protein AOBTE_LOCUS14269 [Acanthoscelides obtectus]
MKPESMILSSRRHWIASIAAQCCEFARFRWILECLRRSHQAVQHHGALNFE